MYGDKFGTILLENLLVLCSTVCLETYGPDSDCQFIIFYT
jgi:hypothetical protein